MQRLINFSVETDNVVWLQFHNGHEQRVPVGSLAQHLLEPDLKRVRAALKLRRDFIKTHAPKAGLLFVAALGLAALWLTGHRAVAQLFTPAPTPSAAPLHENIAGLAPSPSVTVTPVAAVAVRRAPTHVAGVENTVHVALSSSSSTPVSSVATTLHALQTASQSLTVIANALQTATDAPVTVTPTPVPEQPDPIVAPTPEIQPPADASLAAPTPTPQLDAPPAQP